MKVRILRQSSHEGTPYWETFDADVSGEISVAALLEHINYNDDIVNDKGEKTSRIAWDCSCMQGVCGACAMVINGQPALACETFIKDLKGSEITIRPLRKFPVVHDLIVDRTVIQENLQKANAFIGEYNPSGSGSSKKNAEFIHQYEAAKCLKCGLCLEVCPNYTSGENFFGAMFANDCYLISARNRLRSDEIKACYAEHFGAFCSKALSCMDVCPVHIPVISSVAKMNR